MAEKKVTAEDVQTFPAPPTPAANTPVEGEPTPKVYYVVLHDAVGSHGKNAIVSGEDLGTAEVIERLLGLGAVRPLEA